jgi:hypothetical protein
MYMACYLVILKVVQDEDDNCCDRGASTSVSTSGSRRVVVRVPRQSLLSDSLSPPTGGIQGLDWFWNSLWRDEWGNVASEMLEAVHGQLHRAKQLKLQANLLVYDRPPDALNVRMKRSEFSSRRRA